MKAAFNILPDRQENELLHLLVEAGYHGISFTWFSKDPLDIKGLSVYNFPNGASADEIVADINNVLLFNSVFSEINASVTFSFNFKESLLIPAALHSTATGVEMLHLVYNSSFGNDVFTDNIEKENMVNCFAVDKHIAAALENKFPAATRFHSTSLQAGLLKPATDQLYCIVFHNAVKLFLHKDGQLQFVQQFEYNKPVDVAYHLLNCCEQHQVNPAEIRLLLSGMIDAHSNLYNELYKYFLHIQFESPAEQVTVHERIKFYPEHFFSHLIALASCVS